jgi:hypothetical protein
LIETEDTINFRIQLEKSKIVELKAQKKEISRQKEEQIETTKNDQSQQSHLLVQVLEATNLEPFFNDADIDAWVIIKCGTNEQETKRSNNGPNPVWNEAFKL